MWSARTCGKWRPGILGPAVQGFLAFVLEANRYSCHDLLAIILPGITYWEKCQLVSGARTFIFSFSMPASFPMDGNSHEIEDSIAPILAEGSSPKDSDKNDIPVGGSAHHPCGFAWM